MKKQLTSSERSLELERYEQAFALLQDALKNYPQAMWQWKPEPKKWSIHEILIHITDSEANSYIRCRRLIAEPGSGVLGYDQDAWAVALNYPQQEVHEMLELFRLLRKQTATLIRQQSESVWTNTVMHSEIGEVTMDEWLQIYADHIPVHIAQMKRVYEAWTLTQ